MDREMAANEPQVSAKRRKVSRVGVVDSISGRKSVRVVIGNLVKHPLYGKYIRRRTKLMAHDAEEEARVGDVVEIRQCRRISKSKAWRLVRVVKRAPAASMRDLADEVRGQ